MAKYDAVDRYIFERMGRWIEELAEFCRYPSEQGNIEGLRGAEGWMSSRLQRLGASTERLQLPGKPEVPAVIVGEIGCGPRTLNSIQHYDVQPAVPVELWETMPYEPTLRDGRLYARGVTDNKGELLARVWAIEAYMSEFGTLPCRVRFLVEGEEEHGSPHLDALLDQRPEVRKADGALIEDGGVDRDGRPVIKGGVRGIVVVHLICRTMSRDAHSSMAIALPGAAVRLVQALASLYRPDGTPMLDGLETGITPPTAEQLALIEAAPRGIAEDIRSEYGVEALLAGLDGSALTHAMTFYPTLNIQGLWSGFTGPGYKTVTPSEAHARLDIRIVPDQQVDQVVSALRRHFEVRGFHGIEIVLEESEPPYWTPADDPILEAAVRVSEAVFGLPAVRYVALPGVAPMWQVCGRDRVPMTSLGVTSPDSRVHAPNENLRLDHAAKAVQIAARFLDEFAALE